MIFTKFIGLIIIEIVLVDLLAFSILSTLLFLATITREEAVQRGDYPVPTTCEAVFNDHGRYSCWIAIRAHPFLFVLSIATFIGSSYAIGQVEKRIFTKKPEKAEIVSGL